MRQSATAKKQFEMKSNLNQIKKDAEALQIATKNFKKAIRDICVSALALDNAEAFQQALKYIRDLSDK